MNIESADFDEGPPRASEIIQALRAMEKGEVGAADRLTNLVYDELRRVMEEKMASAKPDGMLPPAAFGHEIWVGLVGDEQLTWQNRAHFFAAAAEALRRILVGWARAREAKRQGGGPAQHPANFLGLSTPLEDKRMLAINDALEKFAQHEPQKTELVKLRYFVGLTLEDAAKTLGIPDATARRWWAYARAWLRGELGT